MPRQALKSTTLSTEPIDNANAISFDVSLRAHIAIMRLDHSIKNIFLLPGIVIALSFVHGSLYRLPLRSICCGLAAATLIACSNYVLNEMLDAPFDRLHPQKCCRPAALGLVTPAAAYAQWLLMMVVGMALAAEVNAHFAMAAAGLWIMGCVYNIRPLRTKDVPYLDVLTESLNNPIRMLLGWYMVAPMLAPPASLLGAYWMLGCFFMGLKRFSELREFGSTALATAYRPSFRRYTERLLLALAGLYAVGALLLFGMFSLRYRMELLLASPLVFLLMGMYFSISFRDHSAVQHPEKLYRERMLMTTFVGTSLVMVTLLYVKIPLLARVFSPLAW